MHQLCIGVYRLVVTAAPSVSVFGPRLSFGSARQSNRPSKARLEKMEVRELTAGLFVDSVDCGSADQTNMLLYTNTMIDNT